MTYRQLQTWMWALGMPASNEEAKRFAAVYRAAIKVGMNDGEASGMARMSYDIAKGYTWKVAEDAQIVERHVKQKNAAEHPHGKDAEDLAAEREGRPSRWGTPEFHRSVVAA